jgi:wyosine [tRNA(Phe)-imidazoG37] synthetase (radical SAM superfamily)
VPADEVIAQLDKVLQSSPELDYVTFSGLGEPTLNAGIGQIARFVKEKYPEYPLCLLTNGMLLGDPLLQQEIACVDLVIPSLDASNAGEFSRVNRPAPEIDFQTFIAGLTEFTHQFKGKVWLELFIVPGVNDSEESIARFAQIIRNMRLDKIQLNALDRPGTENDVPISSAQNAARFAKVLKEFAETEFVGRCKNA